MNIKGYRKRKSQPNPMKVARHPFTKTSSKSFLHSKYWLTALALATGLIGETTDIMDDEVDSYEMPNHSAGHVNSNPYY